MKLKPFDKVLIRDENCDLWHIDLFEEYNEGDLKFPYYCMGEHYKQCIPYEGNESLLGTTLPPKHKHEFKDGDIVVVWNNGSKNKYVRIFNYKSSDSYITYNGPTGPMEMWDNCIPFELNNKE